MKQGQNTSLPHFVCFVSVSIGFFALLPSLSNLSAGWHSQARRALGWIFHKEINPNNFFISSLFFGIFAFTLFIYLFTFALVIGMQRQIEEGRWIVASVAASLRNNVCLENRILLAYIVLPGLCLLSQHNTEYKNISAYSFILYSFYTWRVC